jgi:diguanylate cyclase (GGDEF)-like protein/PAS domain S-box-containing protein
MNLTQRLADPASGNSATDRLLNALVWVVLCFIATALPASHFAVAYSAMNGELQTKAEIKAEIINQAIGRSPKMWQYQQLRLQELLVRMPIPELDEHIAIHARDGALLAQSPHAVASPSMSRTVPLFDTGEIAGSVVMRRSLADLVKTTAAAGLFGLTLSGILGIALRRLLAKNRRIASDMLKEQELARVTLHSINDAVITTDAQFRVTFMNPVAEMLTLWPLDEALGRPLAEVCVLIDECSMEPISLNTFPSNSKEGGRPSGERSAALVKKDGASLAVEESLAPIRDAAGGVIGSALVFRDVSATRQLNQRITWAAAHDALTGLVNRREFEVRVEAAIASAQKSDEQHVMLYLDLDQFKIVNDNCGHAAGDALLKQIASELQSRLRGSDTLARLGGDEFGVLLLNCPLERSKLIAQDLLAGVESHRFNWDRRTFTVGVSIGLVLINATTATSAEVFSAADSACYSAKDQGRHRVCVFQAADADISRLRADMHWAARLRRALEEERFRLYYQPYLALAEGAGLENHIEVLIRLIDEDGQLVAPGVFLPAAERYNLVSLIDRWVIGAVFSRYSDLCEKLGAFLVCAINLSGATVNDPGIFEYIRDTALRHRLPAGAICFEITETSAINNMRGATEFMRKLRELGFTFALDDFGVGTSSLAYLKTLPVDYLKIDGSFVRNIADDAIDRAMVETISRVGHIMGLKTVGEYAESAAVIGELRSLGIDFAQGYGVQRPALLP